ncbi:LysR family transcriptional regulator [Mycolicibacterium chitae]|nr:LysR family transcriptional regulator [Mycolicibacterium chitae]MCV7105074.1 LysR family transcriptional regulator [Mycolicibacterium chitae]BBZ05645.1 LysR family transcriptional regulator [Mycolicibacterium chitae]
MEMHHVRYFVAVAEELSFSRAAERLHMAPSPLSRRIKDLERELGAELFVRDYHHISLTEVGRRLLPSAIEVVEKFDALREIAAGVRQPAIRSATVGMAPEVSPRLRSRFLQLINDAVPRIRVRHESASTAPLLRTVARGEVDLAFVHGRVVDPQLVAVRVEDQRVAVVIGRGTGFDDRTSVRIHELAHLPYVSLREAAAPFVYRVTDELLIRHGVHGRVAIPSNNQSQLVPMVAAGQAFTICGAEFGATRKAFADEPVLFLPFDDDDVRLVTYAVWRDDRARDHEALHQLTAIVWDELAANGHH